MRNLNAIFSPFDETSSSTHFCWQDKGNNEKKLAITIKWQAITNDRSRERAKEHYGQENLVIYSLLLNLFTTAILGTVESGRCKEVAIVERF